jgi:hypothetical protein
MAEQSVDRGSPRSGRSSHRAPDPHGAADVAADEQLTVQQGLADRPQERQLRRQPRQLLQLLRVEPANRVVLARNGLAMDDPRQVDTQHVPTAQGLLTGEPPANLDLAVELLPDLARAGLRCGLARVDLAAGKLPPTRQLRRSHSSGGKQSAVPHDGGAHHEPGGSRRLVVGALRAGHSDELSFLGRRPVAGSSGPTIGQRRDAPPQTVRSSTSVVVTSTTLP